VCVCVIGRNYLGFVPYIESIAWSIIKMTHTFADLTLVTSPQIQEEFYNNGFQQQHVDVWRKGIDSKKFNPKYKSDKMRLQMTNNNPNDFLLVHIGRLGIEKRIMDIKPVVDQIKQENDNNQRSVRLCFVGIGPQKEELEQYFDLNTTVFLGQLHGTELSSAFASADAFIMPSDSETLGFVVLESMASSVPVIGCAAGGILDIIHDGIDGYLVQPGDTAGYVSKLQLLISNATLCTQLGQQARIEAEKWTWEAATSYLRNVQYKHTLKNFYNRQRRRADACRGLFGLGNRDVCPNPTSTTGLGTIFIQYRSIQRLIQNMTQRLTVSYLAMVKTIVMKCQQLLQQLDSSHAIDDTSSWIDTYFVNNAKK
jgi:sulfoquinovosyltransferase